MDDPTPGRVTGGQQRMRVDDLDIAIESPDEDMLALDAALERLAQSDERKARVVELRYLVGLDITETAQVLGISEPTVERDWRFARAQPRPEGRGPGHE